MQSSVRSLDVRSRPAAAGTVAQGEKPACGKSSETWESAAEPHASNPVAQAGTGSRGEIGPSGEIRTSTDSGIGFDSVAVAITVLVLVGAYLIYRWKKGRRWTRAQGVEQLLAPGARWMALVRSHVAGRLPWTPARVSRCGNMHGKPLFIALVVTGLSAVLLLLYMQTRFETERAGGLWFPSSS